MGDTSSSIESMVQRFHSTQHYHHLKEPVENKVLPLPSSPQLQPQKSQLQSHHRHPLLSPTKGILKHSTTAAKWKTTAVLDEFPKLECLNVNEKQIQTVPTEVEGEGDTERTTDDDDDNFDGNDNKNYQKKDHTATIFDWDEIDGCKEELEALERSASLTFFLKNLLPEHGCVEEPSLVMDNAVPPAPHLLPSRCMMNARQESMHLSSLFLSSSSNESSGQAMMLFSDSSFSDAGALHVSHSTLLTNDSIISSDLPQASSLPVSPSSFSEDAPTASSLLVRSSAVEYLMDDEDDDNDDNVQFKFSTGRTRIKKGHSTSNHSSNKKLERLSASDLLSSSSSPSIAISQLRLQQPQPHQQQQLFSGDNAFMGDDAPPTKPCRQVSTDIGHLMDESQTISCLNGQNDDHQTHQQDTY